MTDVYSFPDPNPDNIAEFASRRAQAQAQLALGDSPDDASRAMDLGKATGIPGPVVHSDLERIDQDYRSKLTAGIIDNNQFIRDYINAHPLAAAVSNDDYGQLDTASAAIKKLAPNKDGLWTPNAPLASVLQRGVEGFKEGFGREQLDAETLRLTKLLRENPITNPIAEGLAGEARDFAGIMQLFSGIITGGATAGGEMLRQAGMSDAQSARMTRDLLVLAQVGLSGQAGIHGPMTPDVMKPVTDFGVKVGPYVKDGIEPPVGVHEVIDDVHTEQAKADKDALNEMLKESVKSSTRERQPDLYADFARQHIGENEIGIGVDAIKGIYGDKVPAPDDNLLGWVPNLADKLEVAAATGGDVQVPLAEYLAKVEPEIHKEIVDHIRVRPKGLTVEEAKDLPEQRQAIEAFHGTPHEFEQFDTEKIGTGEGAQSYGYGHYLAEAEDVAKTYAPDQGQLPESEIDYSKPPQGSVLKVRIHRRPEEFLDWDKPIAEQPQGVRDVIEKYKLREDDGYTSIINDDSTGQDVRDILRMRLDKAKRDSLGGLETQEQIKAYGEGTHADAEVSRILSEAGIAGIRYLDQESRQGLADAQREMPRWQEALAKAEEDLRRVTEGKEPSDRPIDPKQQRDIAGYQEEINRVKRGMDILNARTEGGTSNYVVFDPKDLEIISKNGEALRTVRQAAGLEPAQPQEVTKPAEGEASAESHRELKKPFAGPPPGFTKQMYDLYLKKIAERRADDADWLSKRFLAFQRKTQSAEWKANREELRPSIADEVRAMPAFTADDLLRKGDIKLASESIPDGTVLPEEWLSKDGIHPDDLAGVLGVDTGRELLSELAGMVAVRGDTPPAAFIRDTIDNLTDARMMEKYGDLDKNIITEAQDHVLSALQEEILHQETMARANEAGLQYSIPPDQLRAAVIRNFNALPISSIDTAKFLADAGRAGRKAEVAGLKGDAAGAFREAQRREFAFIAAREAKKVEREIKSFDRTAKRFSEREVAGVDQEYTNWVHQILLRLDQPVKRSLQDLGDSIGRQEHTELADFVEYKESYGLREVPVADFLLDNAWKKEYGKLTVDEFRAVKGSIDTLQHNGREEMAIYKAGEAADLEAIKAKMLEQIKSFKAKTFDASGKIVQPFAGVRRVFRTALVAHLQAETVMNRLDRFDPKGVFSQYVFRELASGANNEALMLREYSKKLAAIADYANLREKVPNNIFTEPFNKSLAESGVGPASRGAPMAMTRKNLRAVLLNAGNENNLFKMAKGYELEPKTVLDWLHQNATKQDWDWAQGIWNLFKELKEKSDTMYRSLSGIEPAGLEIKPIDTPHGVYPGGYYPLIRHPMFSEDVKLFKDGLEGQNYVRATTPAGYTKSRTGAIYPLSLDLDSLPNQLRQVIHDISLRPAVLQAAKIFYDKPLMAQMKKHLGPEYAQMFIPWLRDVANVQNFISSSQKDFNYWSDFMRQNAITTLVGLNPGTALKHTPTALISSMAEVGPANFLKALRSMMSINEETGDKNWRFALGQSEELQRRSRNWSETMGGGLAALEGRTTGQALKQGDYGSAFMSLREAITELSSKPVAIGDLLSAVPTWLAKYEAEINDHGIHGDAVAAADKAVRQAHGSSAITSRSSVARNQSALAKWMTGFFTFFNDLFNRQVETVWRAGEIRGMVNEGRKAEAMAESGKVLGRIFAYVIAPAMIEELVTPLASDPNHRESWGKTAAKALGFTLSSSWVGVRDLVNAALNGRDPSVGLITTMAKSATDFLRDFQAKKGVKTENVIKHGTQLSGMLTGLTPAPIGRAAEFGYKVNQGLEHPKGPWGWLVGLRYGTLKNHSPTFERYMKGH